MVSIVIYGIIAIALAAAAGYAMLVFTSTAQQTTQTQENSVRLEQAVTALRASLRSIGAQGILYLPAGTTAVSNGVSYTGLPSSLGVTGAAPWGTSYQYCPVAPIASSYVNTPPANGSVGGSTVTLADGAAGYNISIYNDPSTGGQNYVIKSPALSTIMPSATNIPSNVLGFLTSNLGPGQNNNVPPGCDQISFNSNGLPLVKGGTVRAIAGGLPYNQRAVAATDRLEIYTNSGTAGTGDGTGVDATDTIPFSNAIALWRALQPRLTVIYLDGGSNTLTDDLNATTTQSRVNAQGEAPALVFAPLPATIAANPTSTATLNLGSNLNLMTPVTFQNITVTPVANLTINAFAPLILKNSTLGSAPSQINLNVYNTNLSLIDVSSLNYVTTTARQSKLALYNLLTTTTTNAFGYSSFVLYDSDLSFGVNPNTGAAAYTFSGNFGGTDAIHAENSNVFLDTNTTLTISNGALTLHSSRYAQRGTLAINYPYAGGEAFFLDGGSAADLYTGTVSIALAKNSAYGLAVVGGSSVANYDLLQINGNAATNEFCLYLDNSKFNQYPSNGAGVNAGLIINCASAGSSPIYMINGSSLADTGGGSTGSNGDVEVTASNLDAVILYNSSSFSLWYAQLKINTLAGSGNDVIYVNSSRFAASQSNININVTGNWRAAITEENGQASLYVSNLVSTHPYVNAAVYLTRASTFDFLGGSGGASSPLNYITQNSIPANPASCLLVENPDSTIGNITLPAGSQANATGTLGNRYFDPATYTGAAGASAMTVDPNISTAFGSPSVTVNNTGAGGTTVGTVDPTTLDQAITNIISAGNLGMMGNLRLGFLNCN